MTVDVTHGSALAPTSPQMSAPAALLEWASAASAAHQLAVPLCKTDFVPAHFRGNEHAATAAILYGAEAGLSPLQALQGIYVIGGRPALYSRTMLAITLAAGHEVWTEESTDARAVVAARRRGAQHEERIVVTIDQAKRAGWTSNKKYATEPATMLLARAQSQACRRIAPDALLGMAYSAEELQDDEVAVASVEPKRTARRTRTTAEPAPVAEPDLEPAVAEAPPAPQPDSELISDAQLKKLHATLSDLGISQRPDALALLSKLADRDIDSSKSLTKVEASRVIDQLDRMTSSSPEPEMQDPDEPSWSDTPTVPE